MGSVWTFVQDAIRKAQETNPQIASNRALQTVMKFRPIGTKSTSSSVGSYGLNIPKVNYQGMQNNLTSGTLLTGQKIPQWGGVSPYAFKSPDYKNFNFTTPNISKIPAQAYQGAYNQILDNTALMQQRLGNQALNASSSRGIGNDGGLTSGMQATIARDLGEQASSQMRDIAMARAMSDVDVAKTMGGWELGQQAAQANENKYLPEIQKWLQQAQAGENFNASNLGLQGQQGMQNMQLQQIGAMGNLQNQAANEAMRPWQMLTQLYGMNTGIPVPQGGSGKGDPFSALLQGGATVGAAALCLPKGTRIETENGSKAVEEILPGDSVTGGRVLLTMKRVRQDGHKFFLHTFDTGQVVMSDGHPYFDILENKEPVECDSDFTYDIFTDGGFYTVNGVRLGSTIRS